jgi:hypothetical protein
MGVVEEIEGIEGEDRFSRFNVNIHNLGRGNQNHIRKDVEADTTQNTKSVYKAVVEFY